MPASLADILESHKTRRPAVMGVLNVTPDSFSDGGRYIDPSAAMEHACRLASQGADIIDVGAESTRPGAQRVPPEGQIARLKDVLPALAEIAPMFSIDTTSAAVAGFALDAGAAMINDVSAGRDDPGMLPLAASSGAAIVLMHMLGEPGTMQINPQYKDVVGEIRDFLGQRIDAAVAAGVSRERIIIDPGIGFGKKLAHNLAILAGLGVLAELGRPILVGPSRKRFIGELTGVEDPSRRASATVAACLASWRRGATVFRVHDVSELRAALAVESAISGAEN